MDLHLDTLGEDPTRLEFFALRYQQTANDQAAKIIGLEHQITFLTKQLEKERARKQDAPANGVSTSSNGANSLNDASGSSRRSRGATHGLSTPPRSAGRSASSSPETEDKEKEGGDDEDDDQNFASIAQRLRHRKRRSRAESKSPCDSRRTRQRTARLASEREAETLAAGRPPRRRSKSIPELVLPRLTRQRRERHNLPPSSRPNGQELPGSGAEEDAEDKFDGEDVSEEEAKDGDDYEFGYSTLSELSDTEPPSRPQSPVQETQRKPAPAQEPKDGEVPMEVDPTSAASALTQRVVYHLRSPSRELSYFDPAEEERRETVATIGPSAANQPIPQVPQPTMTEQPSPPQPTTHNGDPPTSTNAVAQPPSGAVPSQHGGKAQADLAQPIVSLAAEAGLTNVVFRPLLRLRPSMATSSHPLQPTVGISTHFGMHTPASPAVGSVPASRPPVEQTIPQPPATLSATVPAASAIIRRQDTTQLQQRPISLGASVSSNASNSTSTTDASPPLTATPATPLPPPVPSPPADTDQVLRRPCMPLVLAGLRIKCAPPIMTEEAASDRLSGCRQFEVPTIDPELRSVTTSRSTLNAVFGGGANQVSAVARNGDNFLFLKLEMHPNLPYRFGMPGLMCSASSLRDWKPGRQKLFVGLRDGHVWYVGDYVLQPGLPLSTDEYRAWPTEMKHKWATYIRTTQKHRDIKVRIVMRRQLGREPSDVDLASAIGDRNKYDDLRDTEIIEAYEEGRETMFVWCMECVAFDVKFLQAIHEQHNSYVPAPRVKKEKKLTASSSAPAS